MAEAKIEMFSEGDIQLAEIFKALSHPARIMIVKYLAQIKACYCGDIVEILPLSQSTVSQHLKELKRMNIIKGEIEGVKTCYCLNTEMLVKHSESINQLIKYFQKDCC